MSRRPRSASASNVLDRPASSPSPHGGSTPRPSRGPRYRFRPSSEVILLDEGDNPVEVLELLSPRAAAKVLERGEGNQSADDSPAEDVEMGIEEDEVLSNEPEYPQNGGDVVDLSGEDQQMSETPGDLPVHDVEDVDEYPTINGDQSNVKGPALSGASQVVLPSEVVNAGDSTESDTEAGQIKPLAVTNVSGTASILNKLSSSDVTRAPDASVVGSGGIAREPLHEGTVVNGANEALSVGNRAGPVPAGQGTSDALPSAHLLGVANGDERPRAANEVQVSGPQDGSNMTDLGPVASVQHAGVKASSTLRATIAMGGTPPLRNGVPQHGNKVKGRRTTIDDVLVDLDKRLVFVSPGAPVATVTDTPAKLANQPEVVVLERNPDDETLLASDLQCQTPLIPMDDACSDDEMPYNQRQAVRREEARVKEVLRERIASAAFDVRKELLETLSIEPPYIDMPGDEKIKVPAGRPAASTVRVAQILRFRSKHKMPPQIVTVESYEPFLASYTTRIRELAPEPEYIRTKPLYFTMDRLAAIRRFRSKHKPRLGKVDTAIPPALYGFVVWAYDKRQTPCPCGGPICSRADTRTKPGVEVVAADEDVRLARLGAILEEPQEYLTWDEM